MDTFEIGEVWGKLSNMAKVWVVVMDLVLVGLTVVITLAIAGKLGFEPFIPIDTSMLNQRSVTDMLAQAKRDNLPVALPSQWNPATEPPMLSRVMIDNKLRGDELQKKLQELNTVASPLNKFL